jgi:acetylornithine/N-succinyldiaminopimelate aminotransferase
MKLFDVYTRLNLELESARGSYVYDTHNKPYLDLYGGHAVISIGHNHPHWVNRLLSQMGKISYYSNSVRLKIQDELAQKFGRVAGRDTFQLFLCNSGAEANENALKLASFHTGKSKVVSFSSSFHGRTSLALAAGDCEAYTAPVNKSDRIIRLPFNDTDALARCFSDSGKDIAAVIIEPIQGVGGIRVAEPEFLSTIRNLCDEYGSVFISDEVQCGFGRSGKFFALDHAGVDADIYSMAKGMGNGFPVGGLLISPQIKPVMNQLGTTFGGNPMACAASLAVLEVMEAENLMDNARQKGDYLMDALRQMPELENVRGKGLMIGFDLPSEVPGIKKDLREKYRVLTGEAGNNVIRILPPLNLEQKDAETFLLGLRSALSENKFLKKTVKQKAHA